MTKKSAARHARDGHGPPQPPQHSPQRPPMTPEQEAHFNRVEYHGAIAQQAEAYRDLCKKLLTETRTLADLHPTETPMVVSEAEKFVQAAQSRLVGDLEALRVTVAAAPKPPAPE